MKAPKIAICRTKTKAQVPVVLFFNRKQKFGLCFEYEASLLTQICAIYLFDAKLSFELFFLPMFAIVLNAKFPRRKIKPAVPSFMSPICCKIFAK